YSYGYSYPYSYSYPYGAPYSYGYGSYPAYGSSGSYAPPPSSSVQTQPPSSSAPAYSNGYSSQSGPAGLSFEVTPSNAAVFIDGTFGGPASTFNPTHPPLNLTAGKHQVEIRAEGYQSMSFDVDAKAGEVTPYQGSLQRSR